MNKSHQWNLSYFVIALAMVALAQFLFFDRHAVQDIPYSQFLQLLNEQKVSDLRIEKDRISGKLQPPSMGTTGSRRCGSNRRWRRILPDRLSDSEASMKTP